LTGRSAFVNESCGTFVRHGATQTSTQALDLLLQDYRSAIELITTTADGSVHDPAKRHKITVEAKRKMASVFIDGISEACIGENPLQLSFTWFGSIVEISWRQISTGYSY
jgi:hypothetical protein